MLTPEIESQIADLASRYGQPRRVAVELTGAPFDPLFMNDRFGEVCMVLRRTNGRLLTAIKTFDPAGAFRLLTGGVGHGEPIAAALLREIDEETGLEVVVRRFLAVIEYHLESPVVRRPSSVAEAQPPQAMDRYDFATFAFLLDEIGGTLEVRDPDERIGAFREIEVAELPALAATLANIGDRFDPEIGGSWGDWGRFRAVSHQVVSMALADEI
jgi:8-oxo-dGTP pyrophosphatase MutT (NUDIX family)